MSQLASDKTGKPLTDKSLVRPHDKVKVKFPAGKHHKKETEEEVHPLFAVKMVSQGRASFVDEYEGEKWTKMYGDAVAESQPEGEKKKREKAPVNDK